MSELLMMLPAQLQPPQQLLQACSDAVAAGADAAGLGQVGLPTVLIGVGVVLALTPRLRQLVFDTLETVLATALLLVLVGVVVGLPFAAAYLALKGAAFLLAALLPALASAASTAAQPLVAAVAPPHALAAATA